MLWSLDDLRGFRLDARDGIIGKVRDFYFDDGAWVLRYLAVDVSGWLARHEVLISPAAVERPDVDERVFHVGLTRQQVEDSPDIDTHKPVSRQQEIQLAGHYGWPAYWEGPGLMMAPVPFGSPAGVPFGSYAGTLGAQPGSDAATAARKQEEASWDPNLRSSREVIGYYVEGTDGTLGHIDDLLTDDHGWILRYLIVDTRNWLPGKKVMLPPAWVEGIDWADRAVRFEMTREQIRESPEYDPSRAVERAHEHSLFDFFGRMPYWN
jgi:hypothetical protein